MTGPRATTVNIGVIPGFKKLRLEKLKLQTLKYRRLKGMGWGRLGCGLLYLHHFMTNGLHLNYSILCIKHGYVVIP